MPSGFGSDDNLWVRVQFLLFCRKKVQYCILFIFGDLSFFRGPIMSRYNPIRRYSLAFRVHSPDYESADPNEILSEFFFSVTGIRMRLEP